MSVDLQKLRQVFTEAAGIDAPADQAAYLDTACEGDAELRAEVERLLKAQTQVGDFLEESVIPPADEPIGEGPGTVIGRYKLLEEIGEGAFGRVFMAEQTEPVRRKVALKIIKAGMDTKAVVARFEAERQALALMDHPNIARVLDAGATESGRPYFVMELVRGLPITEYCDRNDLPMSARLQLFLRVCQAVQHAHQKGIIHRDLKPANILVTMVDEPVPKIIDFGVAKALGHQLTEKTLFTAFAQIIGTPAYMSPEQAEFSGVDVDTRSDIYSLGVLFYELLTGVTPFDAETLRTAGIDEIRRLIRETDPPKPSTRLRTLGDKLTEVARHRQVEPSALARQAHGDLDWIIMKALEKDRSRRYETAEGFARDIAHHVANEPVAAGPPGAGYRAQKWLRRHRMGAALAASATVALIAALVVSLLAFAEKNARKERDRALAAEAVALAQTEKTETAVRLLAQFMGVDKLGDPHWSRNATLEQVLDEYSAQIGGQLKDFPELEAEVERYIGAGYWGLSLGNKAIVHEEKALAALRQVFGNRDLRVAESLAILGRYYGWRTDEQYELRDEAIELFRSAGAESCEFARTLAARGYRLSRQGRVQEGRQELEEALRIAERLETDREPALSHVYHFLTSNALSQGELDEAEVFARRALEISLSFYGPRNRRSALANYQLGRALRRKGDFAGAEAHLRESVAMLRWLYGEMAPYLYYHLNELGYALEGLGKLVEAEAVRREHLMYRKKTLGNEHPNVAVSLVSLAIVLRKQDKLTEAEDLLREALAIRRKSPGDNHSGLLWPLRELGGTLQAQGRLVEAEAVFRERLALQKNIVGGEHPAVAESLADLSWVLSYQDRPAEAEALAREALAMPRKLLGDEHPGVAQSLALVACALESQGKPAEADEVYRQALVLYREPWGRDRPFWRDYSLRHLAYVLKAQGKLTEAELTMREAMALKTADPGGWNPNHAHYLDYLGDLLRLQGRLAEAEEAYREALVIKIETLGDKHPDVAGVLAKLVHVLLAQGSLEEAEVVCRELAMQGEVGALNNLAWQLATAPDPEQRDGQRAVGLAQQAVELTERASAGYLGTLAAAYAEVGDFAEAVRIQREAVAALSEGQDKEDYESRLRLFESNLPYRKP